MQTKNLLLLIFSKTALSNLGLFSVNALLPLYFLNYLKFPTDTISFLLFFSALSLRATRFFFLPLIHLLTIRQTFLSSFGLCFIGYILLGCTTSPWVLSISFLLIGLGYGTNSILVKVIITNLSDTSIQKEYFFNFSKLGMVINVGAAIGPLIGNSIFNHYPQNYICFFAALIYLLTTLFALFFPSKFKLSNTQFFCFKTIFSQFYISKLRILALLTVFSGFLYAQFFTSITFFVGKSLMRPDTIGTLFFINGIVVIIGSIFGSKCAMRIFKNEIKIIYASFAIFALSCIVLFFFQTLMGAYFVIIFWTIAEILILSSLNTLVALWYPLEHKILGFTVNSLCLGIGESLGNIAGVNFSSLGLQGHWHIIFISMSGLAFLLMFLSIFFMKQAKIVS